MEGAQHISVGTHGPLLTLQTVGGDSNGALGEPHSPGDWVQPCSLPRATETTVCPWQISKARREGQSCSQNSQEATGETRSSCCCCCCNLWDQIEYTPPQYPTGPFPAAAAHHTTDISSNNTGQWYLPLDLYLSLGELQATVQRPLLGPKPPEGPPKTGCCSSPAGRKGNALSFWPQDSLPPASKTERAGPFVKAFSTLPTIQGSLAGQLGTPLPPLSKPKLISNMVFHMPSQIWRPPEGIPTLSAFEGPLSGMKSLVANELWAFVKSFPTGATFVALFPNGYVLESGEPGALVTSFLRIFKWFLPTWF